MTYTEERLKHFQFVGPIIPTQVSIIAPVAKHLKVAEGSLHLEKASESLKQMSLQMAGDAQQASKQSHGISNNTQQVNRHVAAIAPQ